MSSLAPTVCAAGLRSDKPRLNYRNDFQRRAGVLFALARVVRGVVVKRRALFASLVEWAFNNFGPEDKAKLVTVTVTRTATRSSPSSLRQSAISVSEIGSDVENLQRHRHEGARRRIRRGHRQAVGMQIANRIEAPDLRS